MFGIFPFPNKDISLFPQECKKQLIARGILFGLLTPGDGV
jgi:hypothetical protein